MMEFSGQKDETIHSVSGFTLIEMILTIGVLSILGGLGVYSYANSYRVNLLNNTAEEIVSLARFAQQESMSQKNANASGVRFDNINSSSPFVAVFSGSYAPANIKEHYQLSAQVSFSSPAVGSSTEITFSKLSGLPNMPESVVLMLRGSSLTKTITINASGGISKN